MENLEPDMGLAVRFFTKPVQNHRKTKAEGRPIFEDREYIQIKFPADPKRDRVAPVSEMHYVPHRGEQMTYAERFAPLYEKWKKNNDAEFLNGTPLVELTVLTEAKREELRAQNIRTVEQLAGLPGNAVKNLGMGGMGLVEAAKDYLSRAGEASEVAALRKRIEELEAGQAAPQAQESLSAEFEGMTDEDLKNILTDAGVTPDGRWGRARLEGEIQKLASEAA